MALRVPKAELPGELRGNMIERFGALPEPVEVVFNNPDVARSSLEFSAAVAAWDAADQSLKSFANLAVAAQVGCSWCLDIGYFQVQNQNLDLTKASQVPRWRQSDVFTPLERDVLEYAEAMTNTPTTRCSDRRPAPKTSYRRRGCGAPTSTTRRYVTPAPTSSASSRGKRSTRCERCRAAARNTLASGCRNPC
jgi:alkylhydroperoxidase family enzyme